MRALALRTSIALAALTGGPALFAQGESEDGSAEEGAETESLSLLDAIREGNTWFVMRYRFAHIEEDAFPEDAYASTVRLALGYETATYFGFSGLIEFEAVEVLDDRYNDTLNGETSRPTEPDPEGTEINRLLLQYENERWGQARLGRQRIMLDNQRFVGNVPWRQNEQTFDALSLDGDVVGDLEVFYGFLDNANTALGERSPRGNAPMQTHLVNVAWTFEQVGRLVGYWYYLDYDRQAQAAMSTQTLGARLSGSIDTGGENTARYGLEYAHQSDIADNPTEVDADYTHAAAGATLGAVRLDAGWEVLGGDASGATAPFSTPLAPRHAFNGWADQFLTTPPAGLEDIYLSVGGDVGVTKLSATYHDFSAEDGGDSYGSELDLIATRPVGDYVTIGAKYANYMEDGFATDTQKFWFWVQFAF